jgi:phosphoribosyl-AMP cyclohydrolase
MTGPFAPRETIEQVEEGHVLAPKFDAKGLIPVVTTDFTSGELLMHGFMNEEALKLTIETGEAHYFSRSREAIWHKGATSGLVQTIAEMRVDDDQDCIWLRVLATSAIARAFIGLCQRASCPTRQWPCATKKMRKSSTRSTSMAMRPTQPSFKTYPVAM